MSWEALLSAVIGAVIALGSTLLADIRRDRSQRSRDRHVDRRKVCVEFTVALTEGLGGLREVTRLPVDPAERKPAAAAALAAVYPAREQLLITGTPALVTAGEHVFHRLIDVRDAVRSGAALDSAEYHAAYHPFADALWKFRLAIREDLGEPALSPASLDRPDWTDRDRCSTCRSLEAGTH